VTRFALAIRRGGERTTISHSLGLKAVARRPPGATECFGLARTSPAPARSRRLEARRVEAWRVEAWRVATPAPRRVWGRPTYRSFQRRSCQITPFLADIAQIAAAPRGVKTIANRLLNSSHFAKLAVIVAPKRASRANPPRPPTTLSLNVANSRTADAPIAPGFVRARREARSALIGPTKHQ